MNPQSLSALLAAIITLSIGLSVFMRDRRRRSYFTFAVFCFVLFFWFLFRFFAIALDSGALFWISQLAATTIPWAAERFFLTFLADDPRAPRPVPRRILLTTMGFVVGLAYGALFYPIHRHWGFSAALLTFVFGALYHCMYLMYERQKATPSRPEATRLIYLLIGGGAAVTLALTDFIPRDWVAFPPVGNVLTIIYMYFLSQTLFHYRLLDIKELLGKMVNLSVLVLTLTVIYGLLLSWVGSEQTGTFFFNTVVASFVIIVIFEPIRGWIEDRVNHWMFREKYEFSRRLLLLRRDLANIIDVPTVVSRMLGELEASERVTHASLFLADPSGGTYHLAGHLGPAPAEVLDSAPHGLFMARLTERGQVTQEALEQELTHQLSESQEDAVVATRNILATLEELQAGVCIPLISESQVLGILSLKDDRLREAYASEELEELRKVALQAAITLRNSKVYEQMKERDRLAALGQMAAGLAHEIRNPLGAIKGAAQLLDRDEGEPEEQGTSPELEEQAEYLEIIVEEVNRLDRVVSQFLGYARPDRGERDSLGINKVVQKTLQLLESQAGDSKITTQFADDLPAVRADAEKLKQVFLNLGLNALQAMDPAGGTLTVTTGLRPGGRRDRPTPMVEVAFSDTGRGIPAEALENIFIPFFTTKESGTGLGLPICQRIIESHHGTIEVRSHPGKGTVFSVLLPTEGSMTATVK